jgi:ATP-dependent protease HslVU (ClpYQ) peptidase subunit
MTCIVGIAQSGKVWMGGDSLGVRNGTKLTMNGGKVARVGEFVLGACGYQRHVSLSRHVFDPPPLVADADLDVYMAKEFAEGWRSCLRDNGMLGVEDGVEYFDGMLLVGARGALYEIDSNFGVCRPSEGYSAIGSGDNIALGALYAAKGAPPEKRIRLALEAAERWDSGVRGPFQIISTVDAKGKADAALMRAWEGLHGGKRKIKRSPAKPKHVSEKQIDEAIKKVKAAR